MLGISDQSQASGGRSTVYTVPVGGGTPKRITTLSPSYLHSWSPDGKDLIFTGGRNNEYDIYRIPADGSGPEVNLTNFKGLDDGPEFTPDGRHIYFNSVRSGTMQIWRMKPDGKDPEQITSDEYNNWFPHISPDGQWIAMISFPKEITPTDHPYYKRRVPAADANRRRRAQGDRVRLRRSGHDQRPLVVAGQPDARVRQQHRRVPIAAPPGCRASHLGAHRPPQRHQTEWNSAGVNLQLPKGLTPKAAFWELSASVPYEMRGDGSTCMLSSVMTWMVWLVLAVLVTAVAAVTGIKPKGTRHVARTRMMGMARLALLAIVIIFAYLAFRARSAG